MYVDNFATETSTEKEPETGEYKISGYTIFMAACGAYLSVASIVAYVIVNKYWFLQIYWLINDEGKSALNNQKKYQYIKRIASSFKTLGFLRDPVAYIITLGLVAPFVAFLIGTYLPDYALSHHLPDVVNTVAATLGTVFLFSFLMCNVQACIVFAILAMLLTMLFVIFIVAACALVGLVTNKNQGYATNTRFRR